MNLRQIWRQAKLQLEQWRGISPAFSLDVPILIEKHGSDLAGWTIEKDSLNSESIVYAFGIGDDITFDLSVIKKYNCSVFAFDPVPKVHDWLLKQTLPSNFSFTQIGIADEDAVVKFYTPEVETHISHSSQAKSADAHYVELPVARLSTILKEQGHDRIDILKIDIEGFEYKVIDDILASKVPIHQFLVEFHHGMYGFTKDRTEDAVAKLKHAGYCLFFVSDTGRELSFIKND